MKVSMRPAPDLRCSFLILHSQAVATEKPSFRSAEALRASRRLLSAIFLSQNWRLRLGMVAARHPR